MALFRVLTGGFGNGGLLEMPILLGEFIDACTTVVGDGQGRAGAGS